MITMSAKGDWKKSTDFLKAASKIDVSKILKKYGDEGVAALQSVTPKDTGLTASSWSYEITQTRSGFSIVWKNSHVVSGVNIAMILQYGHGTRNGGYVKGIDYINPALKPIFDKLADEAWKEVKA